jgi:predicted enzyme related to lactoylglutathione lyase
MKVEQFVVNRNSEQPEELIRFYRDIVGLTPADHVAPGAFMVGTASFIALIIERHDEVSGRTKEPNRVLLNFLVEDVAAEQARLEGLGVAFTRPASHDEGFGTIATFVDPDGNLCQLMHLDA